MVSERTGRLAYVYEPETESITSDGSPIRDIASVWDVEQLSAFLGRDELTSLVERSLGHFTDYLVPRDGALILDPVQLGEASGIAHSAFLLLALLDAAPEVAIPHRDARIADLAEGILGQQRRDGSYRVYFGGEPDEGLEFYPGEAMLALMRAHAATHDRRYLASVERAFRHYRERIPASAVEGDLRVFHANWQSQYAVWLQDKTSDETLLKAAWAYVRSLHDRIIEEGFYDTIERHPMGQVTVEVACALEGLTDAYTIAVRGQDAERAGAYRRCIQTALAWLLRAQRVEHGAARERGGFGHSLTDRTQRIDVTGHVVAGFIKCSRNGIEAS
jgi:hypothetical protein